MSYYILFSTTNKLFSKAIRAVTWSEFSHVEYIDSETKNGIGADALKGVSYYDLEERLNNSTKLMLCEINTNEKFDEFIREQLGKPYDWGQIFGLLFRRNWNDDNKWFCSELIAAASEYAGSPIVRHKSHRITPRDLTLSTSIEIVATSPTEISDIINQI